MAPHRPQGPGGTGSTDPAQDVASARGDGKHHLLLAASGSVATIKIFPIVTALSSRMNLSIRLIMTPSAAEFLQGQSKEQPSLDEVAKIPNVDGIYYDASEWTPSWTRGAPILHIELRKWADLMIIAPLSANSLAKMVAGMSDSLMLSVVRAWDTTGTVDGPGDSDRRKRIVVACAMNTAMWRHPVTARHIRVLEEDWGGEQGWVEILRPTQKALACGDVGEGAMVGWETIVDLIDQRLELHSG